MKNAGDFDYSIGHCLVMDWISCLSQSPNGWDIVFLWVGRRLVMRVALCCDGWVIVL